MQKYTNNRLENKKLRIENGKSDGCFWGDGRWQIAQVWLNEFACRTVHANPDPPGELHVRMGNPGVGRGVGLNLLQSGA
jgi:hypothetical protein